MDAIYSNYAPRFLYANRYIFSKEWAYSENQVPYSLVRYICYGSAMFEVNGKAYYVKKDDVFYIPQGSSLLCEAQERIGFISVRFTGSVQLPGEDMLHRLWHIEQQYHCGDQPEIKRWFESILNSAVSTHLYKKLETRGYMNLILAALASMSSNKLEQDPAPSFSTFDVEFLRRRAQASYIKADPRIRVLVDYLALHPEKSLSREEMCQIAGVSESSLRRLFHQQTGKTIHEFELDNKITYAIHRLATTNDSISEIGYALGFESPSYFTKIFREKVGVSPKAYRKQSQEA